MNLLCCCIMYSYEMKEIQYAGNVINFPMIINRPEGTHFPFWILEIEEINKVMPSENYFEVFGWTSQTIALEENAMIQNKFTSFPIMHSELIVCIKNGIQYAKLERFMIEQKKLTKVILSKITNNQNFEKTFIGNFGKKYTINDLLKNSVDAKSFRKFQVIQRNTYTDSILVNIDQMNNQLFLGFKINSKEVQSLDFRNSQSPAYQSSFFDFSKNINAW